MLLPRLSTGVSETQGLNVCDPSKDPLGQCRSAADSSTEHDCATCIRNRFDCVCVSFAEIAIGVTLTIGVAFGIRVDIRVAVGITVYIAIRIDIGVAIGVGAAALCRRVTRRSLAIGVCAAYRITVDIADCIVIAIGAKSSILIVVGIRVAIRISIRGCTRTRRRLGRVRSRLLDKFHHHPNSHTGNDKRNHQRRPPENLLLSAPLLDGRLGRLVHFFICIFRVLLHFNCVGFDLFEHWFLVDD